MTTTEGLQAVRRIITEGIDRAGHTQASFAAEAKIATKTLHNILRTDRTPSRPVLAKIENTLGLIPGVLSDLADQPAETHPETVTLASLADTTTPAASDMTDAAGVVVRAAASGRERDQALTRGAGGGGPVGAVVHGTGCTKNGPHLMTRWGPLVSRGMSVAGPHRASPGDQLRWGAHRI